MIKKNFCPQCGRSLIEKYIEERHRLFCQHCLVPIYENPVPATAAIVLNEKGELLLVKRDREPKTGQWCLPGGYLELNETPEAGCLRELREETGLEGDIDHWHGNVTGDSPFYKSILLLGYSIKNIRGHLTPGDDCQDARFFKLSEMPPVAFRSHREILAHAIGLAHKPRNMPAELGAYVITSGDHLDIAQKACQAGARILQYRDKNPDRRHVLQTARTIREITRPFSTLFIVNDFIDIALLADADGVHLGQEDIPIAEARKITPPHFIIGLSTHSLAQALEAEKQGADYIGSGPIFATPTKAHYLPIGVATLTQVLAAVRIPVVAIGGLNPQNIPALQNLGAKNFAMVRAFQQDTATVIGQINAHLL